MSLAYGFPIKPRGDPHLDLAEATIKMVGEIITPGANFIDVLPILKYLPTWAPGTSNNRKAKEYSYMSERCRSAPFNEALSKLVRYHSTTT
jgi:hypothetical protein